jgi:hypothetical protein
MTAGTMPPLARRADSPAASEAVEADPVAVPAVRRVSDAVEPVDLLAATPGISFGVHRRRLTDAAVAPSSKRRHAPSADPVAGAFGFRARPDPSATDAEPETPTLPAATSAGEPQQPAVWRLHDIVLNVDSATSELRRRISEVPGTARAHLRPALLWSGIGHIIRGQ